MNHIILIDVNTLMGSKKATETQVDKSVDLRIDMVRFSTRRIHFWGQKRRNLAGSLTAIGPDRAYGPRNEHFGHFFAISTDFRGILVIFE